MLYFITNWDKVQAACSYCNATSSGAVRIGINYFPAGHSARWQSPALVSSLFVFWLLCLRERLQSIVMSLSVCLSVPARISPEPHARCIPNFCAYCLCPWLSPPPACWRQTASPVSGKGVMGVHSAGEVQSMIALFLLIYCFCYVRFYFFCTVLTD